MNAHADAAVPGAPAAAAAGADTLTVHAPSKTYPIHFSSAACLASPELFAPYIVGNAVLIVTNETVARYYLKQLRRGIAACAQVERVEAFVLPDGEEYKNMRQLNRILDACMECKLDRKSALVALGGGVVGDMTGFAASIFARGVPFIQVPTTLLAAVDSAVGGKTGVNHPLGKNMIGSFYQPEAVIVDTTTLRTLGDRELSAGLAEVVKYGLVRDAAFFSWCEQNMPRLMQRDAEALRYAMERSCQCKADVVAEDEREGGVRAILNLGHTFGHAIEAAVGYGEWLHGEAVAAGMVMAAEMSRRLGGAASGDAGEDAPYAVSEHDVQRIEAVLSAACLPVRPPPSMDVETFLTFMATDKKVERGVLKLVLLRRLGDAVVTAQYEKRVLTDTIEHFRRMYRESPGTYEHRLGGTPR